MKHHRTSRQKTASKPGLKALQEKKKSNKVIVFETDKSKRFTCDTATNYKMLGQMHIENNEVIN